MNNIPLKRSAPMLTEVERKECADNAVKTLSRNLDEPVEKSIVKKSKDEVTPTPN